MKTHAALLVTLASFIVSTASTAFAAPPAAKVENVNGVSDGQRRIRIIAPAPVRVAQGKPICADRVRGLRPVPVQSVFAQALPAANQPDANADAEDDAPDAGEGGVAATTVGGQIQVLGMELRYGPTGPVVPMRLDSKLQSDPDFVPRFGGADLKVYDANNPPNCSQNTPSTCDGIETVALGGNTGLLVFRARAAFDPDNADHDNNPWTGSDFHREVLSDSVNALVLIDGDNINDLITQRGIHPAFGNQIPIKDIIAPYVDALGNVYLDPNRVLILFELGTTNTSSAAWDLQDLVIALDLEGIVQAPDYYFPVTATGSPDFTQPSDLFKWSLVRGAPGVTRVKGLAYYRVQTTTDPDTGTYSIGACIAATGNNPRWDTCQPGVAFTKDIVLGDQINAADMAVSDIGFHAITWVDRNSNTGLVKYLVSFTKDNGVAWDASAREVGHYTTPSGTSFNPDDIDVAVNDNGNIGILVYYKLTGSPAPQPVDHFGTVSDSLVLYTYNKNLDPSLNNPIKTTIITGSGAQVASTCSGSCFGLTGDSGDTFHVAYYKVSGPTINLIVTSVNNASTVPAKSDRTVTSNSAASKLDTARTSLGVAIGVPSGTASAVGLWDVPSSGIDPDPNIIRRVSAFSLSGGADDSVYTMTVLATAPVLPGATVMTSKVDSLGALSSAAVNDSISVLCPSDLTQQSQGSTTCSSFTGDLLKSHGGAIIGSVYFASSLLTERTWDTAPNPDQYVATTQKIVIHQTSVEP